jgi:hypothetical protein
MGLLLGDELADGQRKILVEGVSVGFLGCIFALLGGLEKGVVSSSELGLEISPGAVEGSGGGARLFDVVDAVLVEDFFKVAAEACTLEGLGEEVTLQGLIFDVLADIGEALLAVEEGADKRVESEFHFVLTTCICGHGDLNPGCVDGAVGAGSVG